MTAEILSTLTDKTASLLDEAKRLKRSLDLAVSRVATILDRASEGELTLQSKSFEVCTKGPFCCKRGSPRVLEVLQELLSGDDSASVSESGCLQHCGNGPNVRLDGIVYESMDAEKARELVERIRSTSKLPIDLILSQENPEDFLHFERTRSLLVLCLKNMSETATSLAANINALSESLPENREERMIRMTEIMTAMDIQENLAREIPQIRVALASVVPLDAFVHAIFATRLERWKRKHNK